jgi:flagellar biosynthetic protein FliR
MEIYVSQFVLFLLLFARVTSLVVIAPVFGYQNVPVQVKVALGLFLAFVLFPVVDGMAIPVDLQLVSLALLVIKEVIVGLLIGFVAGLIFAGVRYAGELMAFDMGFSAANVFDPENGAQNPIVGEFLYLFVLLAFLLINGHHFLLEAVQLSYNLVPIGSVTLNAAVANRIIDFSGLVFVIAVKFAAPLIVSLFLTNIALAILARVMPQMNIFTVSFPLKIGVGLIVLMTTGPLMVFVFKKSLSVFETSILELIKVM